MNIERLEEWYESLLEDVGSAENNIPLDAKLEHELQISLPSELIYIWKKYGICSYGNGIWWHTNPKEYEEIVELWLKGTDYWKPDTNPYYVIGRTAFGELMLWGEKTGTNLRIDTLDGMLFPTPSDEKYIEKDGGSNLVYTFIGMQEKKDYDTYDQNSKHIFDRALKKLGPLKWNEMYAPVPLPMLSGGITIENVEKVEMFTQLSLLREFIDEPEIMLNPMMDYD